MRLRLVLLGIISLVLLTFAITTILFNFNKKNKKKLLILMTFLGLI